MEAPPDEKPKCLSLTKVGAPCQRRALRDGFCESHHPDLVKANAEQKERRERERRALANAGRAVPVSLRSVPDIQAYLEQEASVSQSTGDAAPANAAARVAKEALELLRSDVERQAREIKELLEKHPALARQLQAVS